MYRGRGRIVVVVCLVGLFVGVLVVTVAFALSGSGSGTTSTGPATVEETPACSFVEHSAGGAATTAVSGLYQLALANLGEQDPTPEHAAAVEKILDRYVISDQRQAMRTYLAAARSTLSVVVDMPVGYQVVAYDPSTAMIRLLVVDAGATEDGVAKSASGLIDVTLRWDSTQEFWRMVSWPGNDNPDALAGLLHGMKAFCHAAA